MSKNQKQATREEMLDALQDVLSFLSECLLENGKFAENKFPDAVAEEMWRLYYGLYDTIHADSVAPKASSRH